MCSETKTVTVTFGEPNGYFLEGVGAEIDPHLFRQINTRHGVDDGDWELLRQRVGYMRLQKIRMMIMPEWYEPEKGVFSWDNPEVRSVCRILDIAEEFGVRVNLTLWGAHASKNSWLAIPGCVHWVSPPNDLDAWSENFCALLHWLIRVKGYTCIREITPYNEPNPAYYVKSVQEVSFPAYKEMVMNVERHLRQAGLRDDVMLCTGDDGGVAQWIQDCTGDPEFEAISDIFNSHFYYFHKESTLEEIVPFCEKLMKPIRSNTKKDFEINEFGTYWDDGGDYVDLPGNNSFERGLLCGKLLTVLLGEGCVGMMHWCLFDEYYSDNNKMYRGLWRFKDQNWTFRPIYYAIAPVTRYTRTGSAMFKGGADAPYVAATALRCDRGTTYLLVNDGAEDILADMTCLEESGSLRQFLYSASTLPEESVGALTPWRTVTVRDRRGKIYMPAKSFAVLTDLPEE